MYDHIKKAVDIGKTVKGPTVFEIYNGYREGKAIFTDTLIYLLARQTEALENIEKDLADIAANEDMPF